MQYLILAIQPFNTNFIIYAQNPKDFNKTYRIGIAYTEKEICIILVFCVDKTCFLRTSHILKRFKIAYPIKTSINLLMDSEVLLNRSVYVYMVILHILCRSGNRISLAIYVCMYTSRQLTYVYNMLYIQ